MKILIAGGTGFIGRGLIEYWKNTSHQVTVLGRDISKIKTCLPTHPALSWDELQQSPQILSTFDVVINLCGENIAHKRWSSSQRQQLIDSRVQPTETLVALINSLTDKPRLFNASGVGSYGLQPSLQPTVDEDTHPSAKPSSFIERLSQQWEAAATAATTSVCTLRFGVVLAPHDGALAAMSLPFKCGLGSVFGHGQQAFAWISLRDLCRAIDTLIETPTLEGPVNLVSPQIINQKQFARAFASALHRPLWLRTPGVVLKLLLGDLAEELFLNGQAVKPKRLTELGFTFQDDDIERYLKKVYK